MPADASLRISLEPYLCPECCNGFARLFELDLSEPRSGHLQHSLDARYAFDKPLEVVWLTVAFDSTSKHTLKSHKDFRW